mmetsp:Transcript_3359/g.8063  ORF Transcript_3359/g.8063 Transcript_3359/m.8063 type:complete len:178 (-) Transcript_3359:2889-3422(-)
MLACMHACSVGVCCIPCTFSRSKPAGPHRSRPLNEIAADNLENDRHTVSTYRAERKSEIWEDDEREEMMRESGFPLPTSPSASPAACRAGFESQSDLIAEHASLFASPTLKVALLPMPARWPHAMESTIHLWKYLSSVISGERVEVPLHAGCQRSSRLLPYNKATWRDPITKRALTN